MYQIRIFNNKGSKISDSLVRDYVEKRKYITFDAIQIANMIKKDYGLILDWHDIALTLDSMEGYDILQIVKAGGIRKYTVK